MKSRIAYDRKSRRGKASGLAIAVGVIAIIVAMLAYRPVSRWFSRPHHLPTEIKEKPVATIVSGEPNAIQLQPDVVARLGIKTAPAEISKLPRVLELSGTLALDPTRLQEVRSRFAGEITEIGKSTEANRPLQFGDNVKKGQLVAVLWSRDLGETKSQLVELLVQLNMHLQTAERLKGLSTEGAIAQREYLEAAETVETDRNNVSRLRRTLQTWRVSEEEIQSVEAEANRLIDQDASLHSESSAQWARAEIFAALDGIILEQNIAIGDNVSTDDVLLKIADLSRLRVIANAYEEDLAQLDALPADHRQWQIIPTAIPTATPVKGSIEQISRIIDPVQHTAAVMGWVDNAGDTLRAGQFVTVKIDLLASGNEVAIPATAVVEQGGESLVFVQKDEDPIFIRRSVSLTRQTDRSACIRIEPQTKTDPALQGLHPGEVVVTSGAVELQQVLIDLEAEQSHAAPPAEAKP